MILPWTILFLIIGSLLVWLAGRWRPVAARWTSLAVLTAHLVSLLWLWFQANPQSPIPNPSASSGQVLQSASWLVEYNASWIPQLGIHFHLALDGLSLILIILTNFLGIIAVGASWNEIQERVGFFHATLLWVVASLTGVFLAIDLFLFYFFWELMLVPLYFLIGIWGHDRREYATLKFFIFTQFAGLMMMLAILGLVFVHGNATGVYTFEYEQLLGTVMSPTTAFWLMLGFFVAFAVKLPAFPLHTWLPDAHTEAPTAGSVDLAGLVLKVGAYGFLRFLIPLFPAAALNFAPWAMTLGVIGILYGAVLAFAQTNLKRLVAYTSISHMGFVLLGIFAWNQMSLQGVVIVMVSHGISTGGLFLLVGQLYARTGTRDLRELGGLWDGLPRMSRIGLVLALASLGLPGMGNFIGEFLVLLGAFQANPVLALLATLGFVFAAVYSLWMVQRIFAGERPATMPKLPDIRGRELALMTTLVAIIFWLGVRPQPVLDTTAPAIQNLQQIVNQTVGDESVYGLEPDANFVEKYPSPLASFDEGMLP
ncbi:MAG: NADH-quinone oxidoreductase subunit M [Ardenticatenaceae bacterium]|nr:NADH-quinone oxidoreductase subunit M [Ardenticatenaceae bacterium]MCB9445329.1 NADH-quinone oxidoreductase subunit M [Ardenticatenaceae bacterium]